MKHHHSHNNNYKKLLLSSISQNVAALSAQLILRKDFTEANHWDQCLKLTQDMLIKKFQIKPHDVSNDENCK